MCKVTYIEQLAATVYSNKPNLWLRCPIVITLYDHFIMTLTMQFDLHLKNMNTLYK